MEGNSYGAIARILKVNPQSVANGVCRHTADLPPAPLPDKVKKAELDELYPFGGQKKNEVDVLSIVDRDTRCVLSWDGVAERTSEALQACLERAPQAKPYYRDAWPVSDTLYYGAPYEMRADKQETYSVEAVNADVRHYLKRLARKSRRFSRQMNAWIRNLQRFGERLYPKYSFHLVDFVSFHA